MIFKQLRSIFPDQDLFGASEKGLTFVISKDGDDGYTASCKVSGAKPFDGTRHDLGGYAAYQTFDEAKAACEKFLMERH